MSDKEVTLPAIPDVPQSFDQEAQQFFSALRENMQIRNFGRGNVLDMAITRRDLANIGLVRVVSEAQKMGVTNIVELLSPAESPLNVTTPRKVTGLEAFGAMGSIMLSWDQPTFDNYSYVEVWRSDIEDVGQAVLIGTAQAPYYTDSVGSGATHYYWVRAVSTAGVRGIWSNSVQGGTSYSADYVMDLLLSKEWQPNTQYSLYQYVVPTTDNDRMYRCIGDGQSGASEPTWPTTIGAEFVDGSVSWICEQKSEKVPFVIGVVNGQPAVALNAAFIQDASINIAKIQSAFMDSLVAAQGKIGEAHINVANIFNLTVGNTIQSEDYDPAENTGFVLRKEQPTVGYIAEFYGNTLFNGDLKAARLLAPIIVGAEFMVPSDVDYGTYTKLCYSRVVSDAVNISRVDSRAASYGNTFEQGVAASPPDYSWGSSEHGSTYSWESHNQHYAGKSGSLFNESNITSAPLNIVSSACTNKFNYNRYRHIDVDCKVKFTADSSFSIRTIWSYHEDYYVSDPENGTQTLAWFVNTVIGAAGALRFKIRKGAGGIILKELTISLSSAANPGTYAASMSVGGLSSITHSSSVAACRNRSISCSLVVDDADFYINIPGITFSARQDLGHKASYTSLIGRLYPSLHSIVTIPENSYIIFKGVHFDSTSEDGLVLEVEHVNYNITQSATAITSASEADPTSAPHGMGVYIEFSSSMDNTI